jgi:hypothetical protein
LDARRVVPSSGFCRVWPLSHRSPLVITIGRPLQNGRGGFRQKAGQFRFLRNCGSLPARCDNGREFLGVSLGKPPVMVVSFPDKLGLTSHARRAEFSKAGDNVSHQTVDCPNQCEAKLP